MNRLRHIQFLFTVMLLLLAAGLVSCSNRAQHEALLRAEALMESDPQAARAVLDSLAEAENPPSSILHQTSDISHPPSYIFHLPSKRDAADWAWLKVQADYKCYVPLTSDTLARIATDYYGTPHGLVHAGVCL